jgi:hypothetical protein
MKALSLALCLAALAHGIALANESRHAAIVDMPEVITLSHASPDTWHTLPPVQPNDEPTSTEASNLRAPFVLGQVGRLELRCSAEPTDLSRTSFSLVEFP